MLEYYTRPVGLQITQSKLFSDLYTTTYCKFITLFMVLFYEIITIFYNAKTFKSKL